MTVKFVRSVVNKVPIYDVVLCHLTLFRCLGRAEFHDCVLSWVSYIYLRKPSGQMPFIQRRINVDVNATLMRNVDVNATLMRCCIYVMYKQDSYDVNPAGTCRLYNVALTSTIMRRCINDMYLQDQHAVYKTSHLRRCNVKTLHRG